MRQVWALGCLTYELCTLSPPFVAANQLALARKITNTTPAPLPAHFSMELHFLVMKVWPFANYLFTGGRMRVRVRVRVVVRVVVLSLL